MSCQRKPSLFAQKMQKLRGTPILNTDDCSMETVSPFGNRSYIIDSKEADSIHLENVSFLSSMSVGEIEEKRKELLQILSPNSVEFLKQKRKTVLCYTNLPSSFDRLSTKVSQSTATKESDRSIKHECVRDVISLQMEGESKVSEENQTTQSMDIDEPTESVESEPEAKRLKIDLELKDKGVHMGVVEAEKLKWMEDIPPVTKPLPDTLYNARFDFEGDLLPYVEEDKSTCDKGLYHHGDEPQRPGYAIEELYQLTRSSTTRQRIFALNTLAAILEKEVVLSSCLETELLKQLLDSGIFLILRFSLDERYTPVYLAALRAMSALLWRSLDMHYLSYMVGTFGDLRLPMFEVSNAELEKENQAELKDTELIELDVIKGCLRTNLIQRFRYILDDPLLEVDHYLSIIKCLTRITYHSDEATNLVLTTPTLLETLFENCLFPTNSNKLYTAKLMILFRVIASHGPTFAKTLQARLKLVAFLLNIIGDTVTKTSTSAQCIYLWHVLLHHDLATDSVSEFSPTLGSLLRQLFTLQVDSLEGGVVMYANALITLLILLFERFAKTVHFLVPTLEQLCCQWLNVVCRQSHLPGEFIKLVSNSVFLLTQINSADLSSFHNQIGRLLLQPEVRERLTSHAQFRGCSFLLNAEKKNYVESLPSLCIPASILNSENSISLAHSIVKYLLASSASDEEKVAWFIDGVLTQYVTPLLDQANLNQMAAFWPARYEIAFLHDLLLLSSRQRGGTALRQRRLLRLAFALIRIIHMDDVSWIQAILNEVVFNERVHREAGFLDGTLDGVADMTEVKRFFAERMSFPEISSTMLMSTKRGTECVLPTDWFYLPILEVSNKFEETGEAVGKEVQATTMRAVLRWILLMECVADEVGTDMTLATRYCRVCCVFFCGDVFLEVGDLLAQILHEMLKRNDRLEFRKPIPGVSSFHDFFTQLCEHFASSSYGNPVFAAYVLVPLQQKHDVRLRQYVWAEQTVMLRFIRATVEELPVPIDCYLQPVETNVQLVEAYLSVIATGRITEKMAPSVYRIGLHHVAMFLHTFEEETVAKRLKQKINAIANDDIRNKFLNYVPL